MNRQTDTDVYFVVLKDFIAEIHAKISPLVKRVDTSMADKTLLESIQ